jgi:hypothetical protein
LERSESETTAWRRPECSTPDFWDRCEPLDGHFGNSFEDSRAFVPDLDWAMPKGLNFNPVGTHLAYVEWFRNRLRFLRERVAAGEVQSVAFCHGVDSHEAGDLHGQCSTDEWLACSQLFYEWVGDVERSLGISLPVTLSLFGGYRRDNFISVLSLHTTAELAKCVKILCGHDLA